MSRIGKKPITIPEGVTVTVSNNLVTVKGPLGELKEQFKSDINIEVVGQEVRCSLPENPSAFSPVYHGTVRAKIQNMVTGVSTGYKIALEINGTGYRASGDANSITLILGYSNPTVMPLPAGVTCEFPTQTDIVVKGYDKDVVGQFAAHIKAVRPVEPYHGKGVRYKGEKVRHKEGKSAK